MECYIRYFLFTFIFAALLNSFGFQRLNAAKKTDAIDDLCESMASLSVNNSHNEDVTLALEEAEGIETILFEKCKNQVRSVRKFSKIIINLPDDIKVACSIKKSKTNRHSVVIGSSDDDIDFNSIVTRVRGDNTLSISLARFCEKKPELICLCIEVESLRDVTLGGWVGCVISGIETEVFNVKAFDFSEAKFVNIKSTLVKVVASGQSRMTLARMRVAQRLRIRASGASRVKCSELQVRGSLEVKIWDYSELELVDSEGFSTVLETLGESKLTCSRFSVARECRICASGKSKHKCSRLYVVRKLELVASGESKLRCFRSFVGREATVTTGGKSRLVFSDFHVVKKLKIEALQNSRFRCSQLRVDETIEASSYGQACVILHGMARQLWYGRESAAVCICHIFALDM